MDLDALLFHYFGTEDLDTLAPDAVEEGQRRLALDFGVEREPGRRFALWALMRVMGIAPEPEAAFKTQAEREAARAFGRMAG